MKNRLPTLLALFLVYGIQVQINAQTYNIYFGDIHSHTWYSDGNQDQSPATYAFPVARGITYAKSSPNMNFLGISDHNHTDGGFPMTLSYWRSGFREADSVSQQGSFIGLYGQEWGVISNGGHVLIYGTDKLFGWNTGVYDVFVVKSNYTMLFDSVKKYGGFCYLAHPQSGDYGGIFTGPYNAAWDSVVSGVAMKNGPATSTTTNETNPSSTTYESRYHDLLRLGYHVAPCANQDNHNTTFGRVNQQRTAVLAPSLATADIVEALRNRRTYATEDHNLQLRFEVGDHQMGEIFTQGGPIPFRVKVIDPDGSVSSIVLRYGIPGSGSAPTPLMSTSGQDSLVSSYSQPVGTTYYYYAYVTETTGRQAWSAPVWITVPTGPIPQAFTLSLPTNSSGNQATSGTLRWQSSVNATHYDVYLGTTNPPTIIVSTNQTDTTYTYGGLSNSTQFWWKVVAKNSNGTIVASGAPWNFTTIVAAPSAFSLLLPVNSSTNQPVSGTLSWQVSGNASNYDVYLDTNITPATLVSAGQGGTSYNYSGLLNRKDYYWKVVARNIVDTSTAAGVPWTFRTAGPPPGAFSLASPPDNATAQTLAGVLAWQPSADAVAYDVYLDLVDPPLIRVDSNRVDTSYSYSGLLPGNTYFWKIVAKNENGITVAAGAPHNFSTVSVPNTASNLATSNVTHATLRLTWVDNAWDENGYRVLRGMMVSGPYVQVGPDLPQDATAFDDSGLAVNQRYYYRVVPFNEIGEGNFVALDVSTRALVPGQPVLANMSYSSISVTVDPRENPAATEYAIKARKDTVFAGYVQTDGRLGGVPAWRTQSQWGGGAGVVVTGLHSCRAYAFSVTARNADEVETLFGSESGQTLPCYTMSQTAIAGWNLLSLPVRVADPLRASVFPTSTSNAFFYHGSYQKKDTLSCGSGFWLKYGSATSVEFSGEPRMIDSIAVSTGWNLIGTLSTPISTNSVVSVPPSIVISRYFGYNGVYVTADSLNAMTGYWVKTSGPGTLILSSTQQAPSAAQKSTAQGEGLEEISIVVEDQEHHSQVLTIEKREENKYALFAAEFPPIPPEGAFDVRFEGYGTVRTFSVNRQQQTQRLPVSIQSGGSKFSVGVVRNTSDDIALDIESGGVLYPLPRHGKIEVAMPAGSVYLVARLHSDDTKPKTTSLHQNFPNPFNPTTKIRFELPASSRVTLKVYDMIGREVATLLDNEAIEAGIRDVDFDASNLASGVYVYRLISTTTGQEKNGTETSSITKKMLLQK